MKPFSGLSGAHVRKTASTFVHRFDRQTFSVISSPRTLQDKLSHFLLRLERSVGVFAIAGISPGSVYKWSITVWLVVASLHASAYGPTSIWGVKPSFARMVTNKCFVFCSNKCHICPNWGGQLPPPPLCLHGLECIAELMLSSFDGYRSLSSLQLFLTFVCSILGPESDCIGVIPPCPPRTRFTEKSIPDSLCWPCWSVRICR